MDIQLYTVEDYLDIIRLPENENKRLELVDGVIVLKANSDSINSIIAALLVSFLNVFVLAKKLGYVTGQMGAINFEKGLSISLMQLLSAKNGLLTSRQTFSLSRRI